MPYVIKKEIKTQTDDIILRAGARAELEFSGEGIEKGDHHRLYFTCEDRMSTIFKDEPYGDKLYQLIEDSLDTKHALLDRYCLDMSEKSPREFIKCAVVKRVLSGTAASGLYSINRAITDKWSFGIFAKAKDLKLEDGGYLRFRFERWDMKDGVDPHQTGAAPDFTEFVDIPEGSYDYTEFSKAITMVSETTACIMASVEGKGFSGNIYFERPFFTASNGDNILPRFDVAVPCTNERYREHTWLGMNLSKKEWPVFRLSLNGEVFFEGETFLRIHRYSPVEIDIPDGLVADKNLLTIEYLSDYRDAVPLAIGRAYILEKKKAPFHIHYCPEAAVFGKDITLLIETEADNMELDIESDVLSIKGERCFEKKGLHVLTLTGEYKNNMKLTLGCQGYSVSAVIRQAIERKDDSVVIGSGDLIYIDNSDIKAVADYIEWALSNKTHSLITIRPAYRWGGQRTVCPKVWELFCDICNKMGIDYVHMTDGRDLPGIPCNPSASMLEGEHYLGMQHHERDGQVFYWRHDSCCIYPIADTYFDMCHRLYREFPETTFTEKGGHNIVYKNRMCWNRYFEVRPDMKDAHANSIAALKKLRIGTRHTGPSVMFKYFYEAGFDWAGAETMDSATETLIAFMRGAAKAYGKKRTGVHHAVQWSTRPHDTNERYRRFMLANYVSYLQGVTDINTEEGLWFLECQYTYHNRFAPACVNHSDMQRKLFRFIQNHSRSGEYYAPTAFIHGRYDGWFGFGASQKLFGMPNILKGEAERSWNLLNVFYPLCAVNKSGVTGYFPEGHGKPIGLVSGTPNGNVDVVPVEKSDFSDYKLAVFTSYNCAEPQDMDRLFEFVKNGGTLLATWPHFSTVTYRPDIEAGNFSIIDHPLTAALSEGRPIFKNGACVNIAKGAQVIERDGDGSPLVIKQKLGSGEIYLVNRLVYPANEKIMPIYEKLIIKLNEKACANDVANVVCGNDVQFTRYLQEDGSMHIYLTPVDWYNDPKPVRKASLTVGGHSYPLELEFSQITKIVVKDSVAVWTKNPDFEVLSAAPVRVQGEGSTEVYIAKDGRLKTRGITLCDEPSAVIE